MITIKFSIDKDKALEPLLKRKLREFCIEEFGQEPVLLEAHVSRSRAKNNTNRVALPIKS